MRDQFKENLCFFAVASTDAILFHGVLSYPRCHALILTATKVHLWKNPLSDIRSLSCCVTCEKRMTENKSWVVLLVLHVPPLHYSMEM